MEISYTDVLIQWLAFFAVVSLILVPAMLLQKMARRENRKGWLYFLAGLGIGLVALQVGRIAVQGLQKILPYDISERYLLVVMLVVSYLVVAAGYYVFRKKIVVL